MFAHFRRTAITVGRRRLFCTTGTPAKAPAVTAAAVVSKLPAKSIPVAICALLYGTAAGVCWVIESITDPKESFNLAYGPKLLFWGGACGLSAMSSAIIIADLAGAAVGAVVCTLWIFVPRFLREQSWNIPTLSAAIQAYLGERREQRRQIEEEAEKKR